MQQVQGKLAKLNDPAVTARVQQLLNQWRQDGRLQQGIVTPGNAYFLAMGEKADGTLGQAAGSNNERQQFNGIQPLMGSPQVRQQVQTGGGITPETQLASVDLNEMSPAQVTKLLNEIENKYPDGVPLT